MTILTFLKDLKFCILNNDGKDPIVLLVQLVKIQAKWEVSDFITQTQIRLKKVTAIIKIVYL